MALGPAALLLLLMALLVAVFKEAEAEAVGLRKLRRQKREWIIPPKHLKENYDYKDTIIAKIRSDEETRSSIRYSLTGEGVSEGLFVVDAKKGFVRVTRKLDREKKSFYSLKGIAEFENGTKAEKDIDLRIFVDDENDCRPQFVIIPVGFVNESSPSGTFVIMVNATDDDDPKTQNAKIAYKIIEQQPGGNLMFHINRETGAIYVNLPTLDREVQDKYTLIVEARDLEGDQKGNAVTATFTFNVLDINDNIPQLENSSYEGSVEENRANVVVMRIKALDQDLVGSDNWLAVFTIEAGNEAGYFSITTDPKTNEGILLLNKPLDYEEVKELHLEVLVSNKAEYHISTTEVQQKTYTVKIKVKNQPEGPMFRPRVKAVNITEGIKTLIHTVIATYPAIDGDTFETVKNVRYVKGRDPDNWLKINEKTAEITLNKLPDRESKHLKNGTYYAEIICMTADVPSQTATGTVAIMVEDTNDHCPELVQTLQSVCTDKSILYITAHDADPEPNGPPFEFTVVSADDSAAWGVEHINDTTALLRAHKPLWPGSYQLAVNVRDQQGKSCEHSQPVNFHVCTCKEDGTCSWQGKPKAVFGAPGVSFLLLGLLLLLLVPLLLLFCACWNHGVSGFVDIPFDPVPPLSSGNTEEKGEDKNVPLLSAPVELDGQVISGAGYGVGSGAGYGVGSGAGYGVGSGAGYGVGSGAGYGVYGVGSGAGYGVGQEQWYGVGSGAGYSKWRYQGVAGNMGNEQITISNKYRVTREDIFSGMALSDSFLEDYYSRKANCTAEMSQVIDASLHFQEEGSDSPVGSLGCCSLIEGDNDLEFLNDLGLKFKTLAEICSGTVLEVSSSSMLPGATLRPASQPSPAPSLTQAEISGFGASHAGMSGTTHSVTTTLVEQICDSGVVHPAAVRHPVDVSKQTYILQPQSVLVVEPQVHPTVMLSQVPSVYVLSDTPAPLAHGTLSHGEKVLLVEKMAAESDHGLLQDRGVSASQNFLLMERQVGPAVPINRSFLKKMETQKVVGVSGAQQEVGLSGSPSLMLEEHQRVLHEAQSAQSQSMGRVVSGSSSEGLGLNSSPLHDSVLPGARKVLMQEKKVSIMERSLQGNATG